jgi:hypothetical protein
MINDMSSLKKYFILMVCLGVSNALFAQGMPPEWNPLCPCYNPNFDPNYDVSNPEYDEYANGNDPNGDGEVPEVEEGLEKGEAEDITAEEFVLNVQKLGFIKAVGILIEESNLDLLASYKRINDAEFENFQVHKAFHEDLLIQVKDEVRNHSKLLQTLDNLGRIKNEARSASDHIQDVDVFSAGEIEFFTESYSNILGDAGNLAIEIAEIILDNNLAMNDAERIQMVYILHESSQTLLLGLRKFNNQMRYAANLRLEGNEDYQNVRNLFTLRE